jgi:DNA-binding beta-propeller fold protein YncE
VAVDPSIHNVYVTDDVSYETPGSLSVVDESGDAHTGTVTARIPVGDDPYGVAVDPSNHNVYVTASDYGDNGLLSVIDESGDAGTGRVATSLGLGGGVADLAVDPSTHGIWVAADNSLLEMASRVPADVGLSISGPTGAADSSRFAETVAVTNHGPAAAVRTVTNLAVPAGLSVSAAPGATLRGGTLVWNDLSLGAGASVSHTVTFAVAADVHATETIGGATICTAAYDPNTADNAAVTSIRLG